MGWERVCSMTELRPATPRLAEHGGRRIAIVRVGDDVLAVDDTCTHEEWSLCDGYVDGAVIECSLHQARFCLRTGKVLSAPATDPLAVYPVRVTGDEVWVDPAAGAVREDAT